MQLTEKDYLTTWLSYLEQLHPKTIDLGLSRLKIVFQRLGINNQALKIEVAGTNGKGSTCAMLERIYRYAGYQVGVYTSPHLLHFNERICVQGHMVDDQQIVDAFVKIEQVRGDISLTYFEYTTLAAFLIFHQLHLDVWVLEVGLGGRLDAVNIMDADCAILTSVDLDHIDYLGNTRQEVGFEKAHIFRPHKLAICVEPNPPSSVLDYANGIEAQLVCFGQDFSYQKEEAYWVFSMQGQKWKLPYPFMKGEHQLYNASGVLAAIISLSADYPVSLKAIHQGLKEASVVGRFQEISQTPRVILDVAHNAHSVKALVQNVKTLSQQGKTYAVIGVLRDKNLREMIELMLPHIDRWFCATLEGERGRMAQSIEQEIKQQHQQAQTQCFDSPVSAYQNALSQMRQEDCCLVFGSFLTVSSVDEWVESQKVF